MPADRTPLALLIAAAAFLVAGPFLPGWAVFLLTLSLAKGMVVLGLMVLWRTGLVSFGQALYFGLGSYSAGLVGLHTGISNVFLLVLLGMLASAVVAFVVGLLLARYREIFFAMLSLAFSMILYGILVKSEALGSTDGFNVVVPTFFGYAPEGEALQVALYMVTAVLAAAAAWLVNRYLSSTMGHLTRAIRDNEIRVEYLGFSVHRAVHTKIVMAGALAGAGGVITALAVGHIDPEMAYWTTSGEFVFVTILSGTGSVLAPFVGAILFEVFRSFAFEYSPYTWQLMLGSALLLTILFLPNGLWSLVARRQKA